jgi:UDP-N-acetylglucosamine--N-acetylmuramyl-(pentapeptide) pyrophosphoryl-undecaprenol N-acetylglucosamine transferase
MRLVVTGGGTGGHIYPALAVAEAMQAMAEVEAVTYVGKTAGLESELVPQNGITFEGISFYGMPRGKSLLLPFQLLKWGLKLREARAHARQILQRLQPDVVFGTGGYVSAPVLMAAHSLNIPYAVHEPDAKPGLVNRLMSRNAALITTSFTEGAESLSHRKNQQVVVTGNPIRGNIGALNKADALQHLAAPWPAEQPVLLVTGGSQGARRINQAVVAALPTLIEELGFAVVHLTGKKLYEETLNALDQKDPSLKTNPKYWVRSYSGEMAALLAVADLAVCRAGSLSLSEMAVCGVPTLLVPYPFAASDHQRKNAQACVRTGASLMIEDSECTGVRLLQELKPLITQPERLAQMHEAAKQQGHPQATAEIVACLQALALSHAKR